MRTRLAAAVLALLLLTLSQVATLAASEDVDALLQGTRLLVAPGCIPAAIIVSGDQAFVVATARTGKYRAPFLAAAHYGKGRLFAAGHGGFFGGAALKSVDNRQLTENIAKWLAAGKTDPVVGVIGLPDVATVLRETGYKVLALTEADVPAKLNQVQVLFGPAQSFGGTTTSPAAAALTDFVHQGGGLFLHACSWGWQQLNPGRDVRTEMGGNRICAPMGITWADAMVDETDPKGYLTAPTELELTQSSLAMNRLAQGGEIPEAENAQIGSTLSLALRGLPPEDQFINPRLNSLIAERGEQVLPTDKAPVTVKQPFARLAIIRDFSQMRSVPVSQVKAYPSAATFPGSVPVDAPRVSRQVSLDTAVPAWHSLGLYAAPGETVTVTLPAAAVGKGLSVRIGSHTDKLWGLDSWKRFPEISRSWKLGSAETTVASPFGGLVYLEVPDNCKLGTLSATVSGAVEAPLYELGKTDLEQWRSTIRKAPGPWAELASSKVILTVPAEQVRTLDDPEQLMRLWDQVLDAEADFAGIPHERKRPERICSDEQISAGYMHSGYPIMTWLDAPPRMVSYDKIKAGDWGLFHELGHNHQSGNYTFGGTGEVTVNLFTMYVFDKVCGQPVVTGRVSADKMEKKVADYLAAGAPFDKWKSDPFLALRMYAQLQEGFGWEPFRAVVNQYRTAPSAELPKNDDEKRDQWMVRFSRQVGKNLGPFFQTWGVPTSEKARQSIAGLPEWMPPNFPPAKTQ